jgi:hypothetical protein
MKKIFLVLFSLVSAVSFSQNINDYEFVMVPTKFDFQKVENDYRLSTLLKFRLEEYGFKAFYTSKQLNTNFNDRCKYLNVNVINESRLLRTKFVVEFKDCNNIIVFRSTVGLSKIKDRKTAYREALEEALLSVKSLNYKFNGQTSEVVGILSTSDIYNAEEKTKGVNENTLFAQPIANGFQLIDNSPKIVLKIFKTPKTDFYTATSEDKNGVVFKKNNEWIFEYYVDGILIADKLNINF